jgi:osmotically-inducible protein OsmY
MDRTATFMAGVVAGAGLMFMLDPERGRRRRALARDQVVHGAHEVGEMGDRVAARTGHLRRRAGGMVSETRSRLRGEEVDDGVLEARVRSEIGRVVSNPGAIGVSAHHGRVTLSGPVLERERDDLLASAAAVRGVENVDDQLDAHREAGSVSGLQGTNR